MRPSTHRAPLARRAHLVALSPASSRLMTFAQAMSRRRPTAAIRINSAGRRCPTSRSWSGSSRSRHVSFSGACCLETPGNHIQLALRLGDRAARSKPSDHSQEVESADQRLLRVEWERQEQVQRTGQPDEWIEGKPNQRAALPRPYAPVDR